MFEFRPWLSWVWHKEAVLNLEALPPAQESVALESQENPDLAERVPLSLSSFEVMGPLSVLQRGSLCLTLWQVWFSECAQQFELLCLSLSVWRLCFWDLGATPLWRGLSHWVPALRSEWMEKLESKGSEALIMIRLCVVQRPSVFLWFLNAVILYAFGLFHFEIRGCIMECGRRLRWSEREPLNARFEILDGYEFLRSFNLWCNNITNILVLIFI